MTDQPDRPETIESVRALLRRARPLRRRRKIQFVLRRLFQGAVVSLGVLLLVGMLATAVVMSGLGDERLRTEAQDALARLAGSDVVATLGSVRLRVGREALVALEVSNAKLAEAGTSDSFVEVGKLRFGVEFWPLVQGRLQLANAHLSDARLVVDRLPEREGPGPLAGLRNADGLLDPDLVTPAIFRAVHRIFDLVDTNAARGLTLRDVVIVLDSRRNTTISVAQAELERRADGTLEITGEAEIADRSILFDGTTIREDEGSRIAMLNLGLRFAPVVEDAQRIGIAHRIANLEVNLSGEQHLSSLADRLDIDARFEALELDLGNETVTMSGALEAHAVSGADKIEIQKLDLQSAGTNWTFNGAVGPAPKQTTDAPRYRFELVSDRSQLAVPATEERFDVAVRIAGTLDPVERLLALNDIGLRTAAGEIAGHALIDFEPAKTPGVALEINVRDVDVDQAKGIWPVFAAPDVRRWVAGHVSDGIIRTGRINLFTEPGRFGNGIPFTNEVNGHIAMEGSTVTLPGELPPLRDSKGEIRFRGDRVDIAVENIRTRLASGKEVVGKNGTFSMKLGRNSPLIGDLVVDVDADADAALEYAALKPIDVGHRIPFEPSEISGHVAGRVEARFPIVSRGRDIPVGFDVELDMADIALARPVEGQTVTEAYGTVRIRPSHAEIVADARLNGMVANIAMIEPFGEEFDRSRKIDLRLDDAARDRLLPALSMLLSGNANVGIDLSSGGYQAITADLSGSILSLPWIGWSKGAGIAATTAFQMERAGGQTFLHGFGIKGESFAVGGEVSLDEAGLVKAHFPQVRLNRNDDFSVDIVRRGRGFGVDVKGRIFDARSLIRAVRAVGEATGSEAGGPVPVRLDLDIDAVTGFGNETLRDVRVVYAGEGSTIEHLSLSATAESGARLEINQGIGQGGRFLRAETGDAGAVLRFLDLYERMEGGRLNLDLRGGEGGSLVGRIAARDFWLVDEPRLASLVSSPSDARGRSLNDVVKGRLDVQRVFFDRAFSRVEQGKGYLTLDSGVIRGPDIGSTFQGTVYDRSGNMSMTGTFMPAYGINRIFAEIPLIGQILGNGRDRGLIGITFRLAGSTEAPQLQINPLSAIAPGIFRSVFEFSE